MNNFYKEKYLKYKKKYLDLKSELNGSGPIPYEILPQHIMNGTTRFHQYKEYIDKGYYEPDGNVYNKVSEEDYNKKNNPGNVSNNNISEILKKDEITEAEYNSLDGPMKLQFIEGVKTSGPSWQLETTKIYRKKVANKQNESKVTNSEYNRDNQPMILPKGMDDRAYKASANEIKNLYECVYYEKKDSD
jgi:hypothetical protein